MRAISVSCVTIRHKGNFIQRVPAPLAIILVALAAQDTILRVWEVSQRAAVRTRMGVNCPPRCEYFPAGGHRAQVRGQGRPEQ